MQSLPEVKLVEKARNGDVQAFALLFEKFKMNVYAYAYRLLLERSAAEDALQNSFMKAYQSVSRLEDPGAFKHWLFRIVRNEVFMMLRTLQGNGGVSSIDEVEEVWEAETPFSKAVESEAKDILEKSIGELKAEYREVLILREYEQLSYAEIAALTGASESSVRSRIFKARKALMKKFKPYR